MGATRPKDRTRPRRPFTPPAPLPSFTPAAQGHEPAGTWGHGQCLWCLTCPGALRGASHSRADEAGPQHRGSDFCLATAGLLSSWLWCLHPTPEANQQAACTHPPSRTGELQSQCTAGGEETGQQLAVQEVWARCPGTIPGRVLGSCRRGQGGPEQHLPGDSCVLWGCLVPRSLRLLSCTAHEGRAFAHFKAISDLGEVTFLEYRI